jgi:hypothetical protein
MGLCLVEKPIALEWGPIRIEDTEPRGAVSVVELPTADGVRTFRTDT